MDNLDQGADLKAWLPALQNLTKCDVKGGDSKAAPGFGYKAPLFPLTQSGGGEEG